MCQKFIRANKGNVKENVYLQVQYGQEQAQFSFVYVEHSTVTPMCMYSSKHSGSSSLFLGLLPWMLALTNVLSLAQIPSSALPKLVRSPTISIYVQYIHTHSSIWLTPNIYLQILALQVFWVTSLKLHSLNMTESPLLGQGLIQSGYKTTHWLSFCSRVMVSVHTNNHEFLQLQKNNKETNKLDSLFKQCLSATINNYMWISKGLLLVCFVHAVYP